MQKLERLTTQQRVNLTAYLDGELDEEDLREIEHLLAVSPVARNEVEVLTRTWEMLDVLPRPRTTEEFTERTMETLRLDDYRKPLSERPWFQKTVRGAIATGWIVALVVVGVVGFLATNRWVPHETEALVQELPLIEDLDVYSAVETLEFAESLEKSGLFDAPEDADSGKTIEDTEKNATPEADDTTTDR